MSTVPSRWFTLQNTGQKTNPTAVLCKQHKTQRCLPDSQKPDSPKLGLGFRVRVSESGFGESGLNQHSKTPGLVTLQHSDGKRGGLILFYITLPSPNNPELTRQTIFGLFDIRPIALSLPVECKYLNKCSFAIAVACQMLFFKCVANCK